MNNSHNTPLTIQLLGNFRLWRQDYLLSPESWPTTADKTLLKILAGERGRFFSQDKLIEHIWPDRDPAIAAANLRRRIAELRRVLEPRLHQGAQSQYILTRREGYCFNPEAPCWIDVEEFDRLVAQGKTLHKAEHYAESLRTLEAAIQLYQG
ncbi:winged helix-turn-helix domain-containing protein, partial [Candidatus Acetothermia bacterium]|nr:winged helix-turn-helix domain-containing protein [Candidatus Acetothermia bacterium]